MMCAEFDGEPTPASSGVSVSGNKLRVNNKISGSGVLTDDDHRSRQGRVKKKSPPPHRT